METRGGLRPTLAKPHTHRLACKAVLGTVLFLSGVCGPSRAEDRPAALDAAVLESSRAEAIVPELPRLDPWPVSPWRYERPPNGVEPFGAEDLRADDDVPRIPEPMVFDLVRPLGAHRGEFEMNVLMIAPLNRRVGTPNELPDSIGLTQPINEPHRTEWAPEIEWAVADGLAIEFELPFEGSSLAAYKSAVQWTFGTAFQHQFIHGMQAILLYDNHSHRWSPTVSYVAGVRFDETWSALVMLGLRSEINGDDVAERTERLLNWSIFADTGPHSTLGLETNFAESLRGPSAWLVMPQWHWEIRDHWMLQLGSGARFTQSYTLPETALRLIRSF